MSGPQPSAMFSSADAYDRFVGRYGPALGRSLIGTAGVREGQRALDVGCGTGTLTAELVALLGADQVAAIDPSPAFVEACRARNPDVDVRLAAAESLPFDDDSFDVTLAQLVVNFMEDPHAGVGEMRRVTKPTGVVGGAVWDYGGGMTLIRTFWDATASLNPGGRVKDEQHMRYVTPDELRDLWSHVGLTEVETTDALVSAGYESFEDLWQPIGAGVGPAGAYTVALAPAAREELKRHMRMRLHAPDTPFELIARAWIVTGRVA